jgi:hypothetical protein
MLIDYDQIDDWGPAFGEIVEAIAPEGLDSRLRGSNPEFVEDARDLVLQEVERGRLLAALNAALSSSTVRVFHGTRLTEEEARQIQSNGLRALKLADRGLALTTIFSQHPEWPSKQDLLADQLHRFGPGWIKNGSGRREDDSVHACLSRTGLIHGCNHYLAYGAEVDQHIARALFADNSGLGLLRRNRTAKLISFTAPFLEAAAAANPYGFPNDCLPGILDRLVSAWAYKLSHPNFSITTQRDSIALKFPAPIPSERIDGIEDVDDVPLQSAYKRDMLG